MDGNMSMYEFFINKDRSSRPKGVLRKSYFVNMKQIYRRTHIPKCGFSKVARYTSAWVFFCKFAAYFRNTFSKEYLWRAASVKNSMKFRDLQI